MLRPAWPLASTIRQVSTQLNRMPFDGGSRDPHSNNDTEIGTEAVVLLDRAILGGTLCRARNLNLRER